MTSGLFKCTFDFMYFEDLSNATGTLPTLGLEWVTQRPSTSGDGVSSISDQTGEMEAGEIELDAAAVESLADDSLSFCSAARYGGASSSTSSRNMQTTVYNEDWGEYGGVIGSLAIWCVSKLIFASLSLTIFAPAGCLGPCIAIGTRSQYHKHEHVIYHTL